MARGSEYQVEGVNILTHASYGFFALSSALASASELDESGFRALFDQTYKLALDKVIDDAMKSAPDGKITVSRPDPKKEAQYFNATLLPIFREVAEARRNRDGKSS